MFHLSSVSPLTIWGCSMLLAAFTRRLRRYAATSFCLFMHFKLCRVRETCKKQHFCTRLFSGKWLEKSNSLKTQFSKIIQHFVGGFRDGNNWSLVLYHEQRQLDVIWIFFFQNSQSRKEVLRRLNSSREIVLNFVEKIYSFKFAHYQCLVLLPKTDFFPQLLGVSLKNFWFFGEEWTPCQNFCIYFFHVIQDFSWIFWQGVQKVLVSLAKWTRSWSHKHCNFCWLLTDSFWNKRDVNFLTIRIGKSVVI